MDLIWLWCHRRYQLVISGFIRLTVSCSYTTPGPMMPLCHHSEAQDKCSLYFSQPDFQFSWFPVTVDYSRVLGPFIGGLMIISTHVIQGLLIVTTAINWNIFLVTLSIIYLFVLTPSVYPPYLLSYQHCSLINRLTFTLSWKSIDIVCTL